MKKLLAILLAACLVFAFAGCGEKTSGDAIKLGGIGPISGAAAVYGQAVQRGAEIAVEEINALDGLKFEFKMQDDEHDAEKSVNAYNSLKDWGMQILVGSVTTQPCIAVSTESNADNIFELTPSASSTDVLGGQPDADGNVTIQRKNNVFQMCFTDPNQGIASAQYIFDQKLGEKIGVIYNSADAYSKGIYQKFMSKAKELGLNVVAEEAFASDDNADFNAQLTAIKAKGADLIFMPIYYTPASLILAQAAQMQYDVDFFGVDGLDGLLGVEGFDTKLAEGVMLLTPFTADAEDEKTQNFVKKYKEKYGEVPNQFAADAYDCVYAIYEACKAQNVTADMSASDICDKLVEQFTKADFKVDGLTGNGMTWSNTGEVSKSPKGMKIENGVYVGL
ncbi:MAG: ABC transporter substrate-binding protein [Clostridia bacterium]|nr:ABC transporter substrate-binding protein [Clostridia bacterium]MBQ5798257.1 ABC transporter substrate-binding protein [Clostridia bacterium]MEE1277990.1 ABC transporter substrate-binding protein [Acutalibacteraceae bacterium]